MGTDLEQSRAGEVARLLAAVETERRYYQDIVASMPVGLLVVASDLSVVSSNREVRRIFGLRPGEPLQGRLDQFLPAGFGERVAQVAESGIAQRNIPVQAPHGFGRALRINISSIRNWDDDSQPEALLTIQETELANAADGPLSAPGILAGMDAVIWAAELPSKRFLFVNEHAQEVLGHPLETWLETPSFWSDRIHPDDRGWMLPAYERSIENGSRYSCEYRALQSGGQVVWLRESARALEDSQGQSRHLVGFAIDITQRRLLEDQYVQAQRVEAASRMAGRIANEIATQAAAIAGHSEEILKALEPTHPSRAGLLEILAATDRLRALTGQLTFGGRPPAGTPQLLDAVDLLRKLEPGIRKSLGETVNLELKLFPAMVGVSADPVQLEQLIAALVQRARRGIGTDGTVTIECSPVEIEETLMPSESILRPGVYAEIRVEDNGRSMDRETRSAMFESFLPSRDAGEDFGPLLARLYSAVKQWGGDIAVSSLAPRGNLFQIFLPRVGEHFDTLHSSEAETKTGSILVVESDAGIRALVQNVLLRHDFQVVEAEGAEAAVQRCEENPGNIDLMIADVTMREPLEQLQKACPGLETLYLTDQAGSEAAQDFPTGTSFLKKPFSLADLVKHVQQILSPDVSP